MWFLNNSILKSEKISSLKTYLAICKCLSSRKVVVPSHRFHHQMDQCHAFKSQSTKQLTTLMRALLIQWMILKGFDYFHLSFLCRYALLSFTRLQSDILLPNNLLKIYVFKKFSFEFCINSRYFLFHWRKKIFNICGQGRADYFPLKM